MLHAAHFAVTGLMPDMDRGGHNVCKAYPERSYSPAWLLHGRPGAVAEGRGGGGSDAVKLPREALSGITAKVRF